MIASRLSVNLVAALLLVVGCLGCGKESVEQVEGDPVAEAASLVRMQVISIRPVLAKNTDDAKNSVNGLTRTLEGLSEEQMGPHTATYQAIKSAASELSQLYEQSGSKSAIQSKAKQLVSAASKLPSDPNLAGK